MAAKTIDQVAKTPNQKYATKPEVEPAFRPRNEARVNNVTDATKDIDSLLGSQANKIQQSHKVSVDMAKRVAVDHLSTMGEEINFINSQMGDSESRDMAISRLQSSIASTSAVAQGFSGDAAEAYDSLYMGSARQMATKAMSTWKTQQKAIDKNRMITQFKSFIDNSYTNLPPEGAKMSLGVWKSSMAVIDPAMVSKLEDAATSAIVDSIIKEVSMDPTQSISQVADRLKNRQFQGEVEVGPDGIINYTSGNLKRDAAVGKVLNTIFLKAKKEKEQSAKERKIAHNKAKTENDASFKRIVDSIDESTPEGKRLLRELNAIKNGGSRTAPANDDELTKYVVGKESAGTGGYTAQNPKSTAYGRYQFLEVRAGELWKQAGFKHKMVHGQQTPEEQDAMWEIQKNHLRQKATDYGQVASAENMYIIHQLGPGGAKKYFNDNMDEDILKAMNGQLGDDARDDFRSDPEGIMTDWVARYNPSLGQSTVAARSDGAVSKSELVIAKKYQAIRKRQLAAATSASKVKTTTSKVSKATKATVGMYQDAFAASPTAEKNQAIVDAMRASGEYSAEEVLRESKKFENYVAKTDLAAEKVATKALVVETKATETKLEKLNQDDAKQAIKNIDNSNANKFDTNSQAQSIELMNAENERREKLGLPDTWSPADIEARKIAYAKGVKEVAEEALKELEEFQDKTLANNLSNTNKLISDQLQILQDTPAEGTAEEMKKLDALYEKVNKIFWAAGKAIPFPKAKELRNKAVEKNKVKETKADVTKKTLAAKKVAEAEVKQLATGIQTQANALEKEFADTSKPKDKKAWQDYVSKEGAAFKKKYGFDPLLKDVDIDGQVSKHIESKVARKIAKEKKVIENKAKTAAKKEFYADRTVRVANIKEDFVTDEITADEAQMGLAKINKETLDVYGQPFLSEADMKSWGDDADSKKTTVLKTKIDTNIASYKHRIEKGETTELEVIAGMRSDPKYTGQPDVVEHLTQLYNTAKANEITDKAVNPVAHADVLMDKEMNIENLAEMERLVKTMPVGIRDKYNKKINAYKGSDAHKVDILSDTPLDEPLNIKGLSDKMVKEIKENKTATMRGVIVAASKGNQDEVNNLAILYGPDRKTAAPSWLQTSAAKAHLVESMATLDGYMKSMQANPILMNNQTFISAGRSKMSDNERAKLGLYKAFINVNPQGNYDDTWQKAFEIAFTATNYKRAIKDATGVDVPEYVSSDEMTSFFENLSTSKIPVDEKQDAFIVALTMDKMGMGTAIQSMVGGSITKYQTYDSLRGGRVDSHGAENLLMEVNGDPLKMWSIIRHAMIKEHKLTAAEADVFQDDIFAGNYVIKAGLGGTADIIFDNKNEDMSVDGQRFTFNEAESKIVRLDYEPDEEVRKRIAGRHKFERRVFLYDVVYQKEALPEPEERFGKIKAFEKKRKALDLLEIPTLGDVIDFFKPEK